MSLVSTDDFDEDDYIAKRWVAMANELYDSKLNLEQLGSQLSAHRNNNEKLANTVEELSVLNASLKRTNGALEARIKYLEIQLGKNGHSHKLFKPLEKTEQNNEQLVSIAPAFKNN